MEKETPLNIENTITRKNKKHTKEEIKRINDIDLYHSAMRRGIAFHTLSDYDIDKKINIDSNSDND